MSILPSPNNKRQRYEIYGLRTSFKQASNMPLSVHGKIAQLYSLVKLQEILACHHRHYHNAPSEHYHVLPRDYRAGSCGMRREFHSITQPPSCAEGMKLRHFLSSFDQQLAPLLDLRPLRKQPSGTHDPHGRYKCLVVPALPGGWRRREGEKEKERRNAGVIRSRRKCRENVRRAFTIRDKIAEARILTAWSQRSSRKCLHRFEVEEQRQRREGAGKDGLWKTKRGDGAVGRLSLFMHPREG